MNRNEPDQYLGIIKAIPVNSAVKINKWRENIMLEVPLSQESGEKDRPRRITALARKVQKLLSVTPLNDNQEQFLQTILRDYQYPKIRNSFPCLKELIPERQ